MKFFLRLLRFEFEQRLLTKRWLLPIPVMLFIAYTTIGTLVVQSLNARVTLNTWDALFGMFANQNIVFFVLTFLLLYLASGMMPEGKFEQAVLLRYGSRRGRWLSKVTLLAIAVLLYLGMNVGIVAGVAAFVLPWQAVWSQGARQFPEIAYVQSGALALAPSTAFAELALLLALGWFVLGLLVLVSIQYSNRTMVGLLVGVVVVLAGMAAQRADLSAPLAWLFIHQHLLFNLHSFGETVLPYPPLWLSVSYWLVGGAVLIGLGSMMSKRQDFFAETLRR